MVAAEATFSEAGAQLFSDDRMVLRHLWILVAEELFMKIKEWVTGGENDC